MQRSAVNYQAFTNDSIMMMYESIRGALAADDALEGRRVIAEGPQRTATFRIQTARQAMVKPFPSKTHIGNHMLHPETLMLNYGYDPQL